MLAGKPLGEGNETSSPLLRGRRGFQNAKTGPSGGEHLGEALSVTVACMESLYYFFLTAMSKKK